MNWIKTIYWITTSVIAAMMLFSGYNSLNNAEMIEGFRHLGFPDYFRIELGIAKLLGAIVLIVPKVPIRLKEWAYVGFGITYISAAIAHLQVGDLIGNVIAPFVFLAILVTSYLMFHKTKT
ncbi:DoxX family protein [Leptospira noumeaensis]|uniref:DoxX family protein n=1 Tax=Leptospira noumeaensis TaxID=2484964 RepID=A0A4R9I7Y6_9LEPT|nr:DoxX family protein [Leptospira noumeaensis]TGK81846.1 DoxX family protein [Leptospira noumeaensis]